MVSSYREDNYKTNIQELVLSRDVSMFSIQPYCGSNTYLLLSKNDIVIIDTGYSIYAEELLKTIKGLIPDWDRLKKRIYITHADVDHCGLLYKMDSSTTILNEKSAETFRKQHDQLPDYREQTELHLGYSKISRIISGYIVPDITDAIIIDHDTPKDHNSLLLIGHLYMADMDFEILEGSGGHLYGEMIYVNRETGIVFTGDILVNIDGFSKDRAEFNSLAPFLMKSVNVNSEKARKMRHQTMALIEDISIQNGKPCIVCGGHGPVSEFADGKLISVLTEFPD
jgi:glyoxylase-like metal-dependent hydrolase (beta-lactamase superfamily II)